MKGFPVPIQPTLFLLFLLTAFFGCQDEPVTDEQHGAEIYGMYCAGCHGSQLEGGSATTLIKTDWKYGRALNTMTKNVRFGIPGTEMAAWDKVLSLEEVNDVLAYIIQSQSISPSEERSIPDLLETALYDITVEELATEGMGTPWGIEFVSDSLALISEREGGLRWIVNGKLDPVSISGLPETYRPESAMGFMDIALDPDYLQNGWIYLAYTFTEDSIKTLDARGMTEIVRGRIEDHQWIDMEILFEAPDSLRIQQGNRFGSRLMFDQEGYLYFTIGDMHHAEHSQSLEHISGKVYRIHPDGRIPEDNPFPDLEGVLAGIYSLGNRNVQGIVQDPIHGTVWMTEHGPMGGDELNILKKGANYGWPAITYGIDYSGDTVSQFVEREGMEQPITYWTPSIAVCPLEYCEGRLFSEWSGNLFVGALAYEEVRRLVMDGQKVIDQEVILKGVGRVRDIKFSPKGHMYVLLNGPNKILRLKPVAAI